MKAKIIFITIVIITLGLYSCNSKEKSIKNEHSEYATSDNSMNSLDWEGVYTGIVPCADCEGISTILILNKDLSYTLSTKYIGKSDSFSDSNGKFSWNEDGSIIILDEEGSSEKKQFQVGENKIKMLDNKGLEISGELAESYILKKVKQDIIEKYWKLIELNGNEVVWDDKTNKEPYIILKIADNRVVGNGSCNNLMGAYELKEGNEISFSRVASTLRACPNMDLESKFLKIFDLVNKYSIDGEILMFFDSNNNVLAKFKVVYL